MSTLMRIASGLIAIPKSNHPPHFPFSIRFLSTTDHPDLSPLMFCVRSQKGSGGRGLLQTEETMKLITQFELTKLSTNQLHSLYRDTFNALCGCKPHSAEQRTCLASLKNLEDEINSRMP